MVQTIYDKEVKGELCNQSRMAAILGCTPRTVGNLTRRGKIPVIRVGRLVRFQPHLVIEALSEGRPT
jgi:excisionase family DNA binding protein